LNHLFFKCAFARISWRSSHWPLDSLKWPSLNLPNWIKGILSPNHSLGIPLEDTHLFQIYAAVLCDMLWLSRNKAIHEGVIPEITKFAEDVRRIPLEHQAAWKSKAQPAQKNWSPPQAGNLTINFATYTNISFSVQAAICRNSTGKIVKALYQYSPPYKDLYNEAQAALLAAALARSLNLNKFFIEGHAPTVIYSIQQPSFVVDKHLISIISSILSLMPLASLWYARNVTRSENFCSLFMAKWAAARVTSGCIPTLFTPLSPPLSYPICSGKDPPPFPLL
jgi:hypothetical protein